MNKNDKKQKNEKSQKRSLTPLEIFRLSISNPNGLGLTMLSGCTVDDNAEFEENDSAQQTLDN